MDKLLSPIHPGEVLLEDFMKPLGIPAERVKILQDAFAKTLKDPDLLAEAKKKNLEAIDPISGEDLENLAKDVMWHRRMPWSD